VLPGQRRQLDALREAVPVDLRHPLVEAEVAEGAAGDVVHHGVVDDHHREQRHRHQQHRRSPAVPQPIGQADAHRHQGAQHSVTGEPGLVGEVEVPGARQPGEPVGALRSLRPVQAEHHLGEARRLPGGGDQRSDAVLHHLEAQAGGVAQQQEVDHGEAPHPSPGQQQHGDEGQQLQRLLDGAGDQHRAVLELDLGAHQVGDRALQPPDRQRQGAPGAERERHRPPPQRPGAGREDHQRQAQVAPQPQPHAVAPRRHRHPGDDEADQRQRQPHHGRPPHQPGEAWSAPQPRSAARREARPEVGASRGDGCPHRLRHDHRRPPRPAPQRRIASVRPPRRCYAERRGGYPRRMRAVAVAVATTSPASS